MRSAPTERRPQLPHVQHITELARGPEGRHCLLRRARHQRGAALDARERRAGLRVHRQSRPARRARLRRHSAPGVAIRRQGRAAHRLPRCAGGRGHRGAPGRRLSHLDRRCDLFQYDSHRARGHRHAAGGRDARRRRAHLGRRQHLQGQRHRALLSLRLARQSCAAHLQAVARRSLHRRAGRPQGDVRLSRPRGLRLQDEQREGLFDRFESAGRHARSEGPRVSRSRHEDRPADHVCRLLARRRGGPARDGDGALRRGPARGAQRRRRSRTMLR